MFTQMILENTNDPSDLVASQFKLDTLLTGKTSEPLWKENGGDAIGMLPSGYEGEILSRNTGKTYADGTPIYHLSGMLYCDRLTGQTVLLKPS